jgi:hypothetical protein
LAALAPQLGVELFMPRLGEPFEPERAGAFTPWWRAITALEKKQPPLPLEPQKPERALETVEWPMD